MNVEKIIHNGEVKVALDIEDFNNLVDCVKHGRELNTTFHDVKNISERILGITDSQKQGITY